MRHGRVRTAMGALGMLGLLLAGCGGDDGSTEPEALAGDVAEDDATPEADPAPATDDAVEDDEDAADDGGSAGDDGAAAGTAVVTIGDERYETDDLGCPDSISGVEFFGAAEGPRDNARIHGRFASSLPELIAVSFDRGNEGEWAAVAENNVLERGVLEDYTFDEEAGTFAGTATFVWVENGGLQDPDSLTDGTFEVRCG